MEKIQNFINGELLPPNSGEYIDNFCPATGEAYSLIPDSDGYDVDMAVKAAQEAFQSWSTTSKQDRSDILMHLADEIEAHSVELVTAESMDNGKRHFIHTSVYLR